MFEKAMYSMPLQHMKNRKRFVILLALTLGLVWTAFAEDPPMTGWEFTDLYVTLKGHGFTQWEYAASYREQEGYAIVQGSKRRYWLYDTYAYHNGNSEVIYNQIVPHWVEKMGYVIDYDNIRRINPNPSLASSVKALMTQRGCDVSVTLFEAVDLDAEAEYNSNGLPLPPKVLVYVAINEYSKSKGIYWTTIYPLVK